MEVKDIQDIKNHLENLADILSSNYSELSKKYVRKEEFNGLEQHITDIICPINDKVDGINKRLDRLNGQVGKNTSFRNQAIGGFILLGFIGIANLILMFTK